MKKLILVAAACAMALGSLSALAAPALKGDTKTLTFTIINAQGSHGPIKVIPGSLGKGTAYALGGNIKSSSSFVLKAGEQKTGILQSTLVPRMNKLTIETIAGGKKLSCDFSVDYANGINASGGPGECRNVFPSNAVVWVSSTHTANVTATVTSVK